MPSKPVRPPRLGNTRGPNRGSRNKPKINPLRFVMRTQDPYNVFIDVVRAALRNLPSMSEARVVAEGYLRSRRLDLLYSWAEALKDTEYPSAYEHFIARQLAYLILKYPLSHTEFGLPKHPDDVAFATFQDAEDRCARSNRRFSRRSSIEKSRFYPLMEDMRRFISAFFRCVPDDAGLPTSQLLADGEWLDHCAWGSGANVGVHGKKTSQARKFTGDWTATRTAVGPFIHALWRNTQMVHLILSDGGDGPVCYDRDEFTRRVLNKIRITDCNKLDFVPKTAKTSRSIAVEPVVNTFLQKGLDWALRLRLKQFGYDLTDQGANQKLAREGSVSGDYSTIDLSSASDTVSRGVFTYLLPADVRHLLLSVSSGSYRHPTRVPAGLPFNKVTSMGNGICFPLETLIFAAAVRASMRATRCKDRRHCVYGDDLVVPTECTPVLIPLLRFLGFVPNSAKTFTKGNFRESCGADWYKGLDVRPVEFDRLVMSYSDLMIVHNGMQRSDWTEEFFRPVRELLLARVPPHLRLLGPASTCIVDYRTLSVNRKGSVSDIEVRNANGCFIVPDDVFMASSCASWHRSERRWRFRSLKFRSREDSMSDQPAWLVDRLRLLSCLSGSPGGRISLRFTSEVRITVR